MGPVRSGVRFSTCVDFRIGSGPGFTWHWVCHEPGSNRTGPGPFIRLMTTPSPPSHTVTLVTLVTLAPRPPTHTITLAPACHHPPTCPPSPAHTHAPALANACPRPRTPPPSRVNVNVGAPSNALNTLKCIPSTRPKRPQTHPPSAPSNVFSTPSQYKQKVSFFGVSFEETDNLRCSVPVLHIWCKRVEALVLKRCS
jgi:hypothetical protein